MAYPFSHAQRVEFSLGGKHISFDRELQTGRFPCSPASRSSTTTRSASRRVALARDRERGPGLRQLFVRRHQADPGPALPARGQPDLRLDQLRGWTGGPPPLFHAGRPVHHSRRGCCTTAATAPGRRRPAASAPFHRLAGHGARLHLWLLQWPRVRSAAGRPDCLPRLRPAAREPCPGRQPELRFPLFGVLGMGSGYYGALPLDFTVFGDGGLAWDNGNEPFVGGPDPRSGLQRRRRLPDQPVRLCGGGNGPGSAIRPAGEELDMGVRASSRGSEAVR